MDFWKRLLLCLMAAVMVISVGAAPVQAIGTNSDGDEIVIVIDPGHGGNDGGAEGKHDGKTVNERDLTWKIANYCKDYLEENYGNVKVLLSRTETSNPSLATRVQNAVDNGADFFLSIHLNATESGKAHGVVAIVPRGKYRPEQAAASKETATAIKDNLIALGLADQGFMTTTSDSSTYPGGYKADGFAVIRYCVRNNIPGIIMEQAFIDNYSDYINFLSSDAKLKQLGIANAKGLAETLGLTAKETTPEEPGTTAGYTISHTDVTLQVGESFSLKLKDSAGNAVDAAWTVDDAAVASVSGNTVTGLAAGTTNVWTEKDGVTYKCIVRVKGGESAPEETTGLPFTDVSKEQWFYEGVEYVYEKGLMKGMTETTFEPGTPVSRAMVVTLLYRHAGSPEAACSGTFEDVAEGTFYTEAVEWAYANGVTTGITANQFAPGETVTREQFVTFLWRYAKLTGMDVSASQDLSAFPDGGSVSAYARDAVSWAVAGGILTGYEDGTIRPRDSLQRCQLAVLICRFDQGDAADEPSEEPQEPEQPEETHTWTISHTDVTIKVGESFYLKLKNENGETASVTWTASKSGYVTISGNKITGAAKGTITVSCVVDGETYSCIVRVKNT